MEHVKLELNGDKFDKAVHGGLDALRVLPECGDLAVYVKPNATVAGKPMVVFTFTVVLPDGSHARVQATTTLAIFDTMRAGVTGWDKAGVFTPEGDSRSG